MARRAADAAGSAQLLAEDAVVDGIVEGCQGCASAFRALVVSSGGSGEWPLTSTMRLGSAARRSGGASAMIEGLRCSCCRCQHLRRSSLGRCQQSGPSRAPPARHPAGGLPLAAQAHRAAERCRAVRRALRRLLPQVRMHARARLAAAAPSDTLLVTVVLLVPPTSALHPVSPAGQGPRFTGHHRAGRLLTIS